MTMQILVILYLFIFSSFTYAGTGTLSDLMYLNAEKAFRYNLEITDEHSEMTMELPSATFTQKDEGEEHVINNSFLYGLSSTLQLGLDLNYKLADENKTTSQTIGGTLQVPGTDYNGNATDDKGLKDPIITVRYRISEQSNYLLDLTTALSPSMGDKESGQADDSAPYTAVSEGNAYRGGHQLTAGAIIGSKPEQFQWSFGLEFEYNGKQTTKELAAGSSTASESETDSQLNIRAEGGAQYTVLEKLALGVKITYLKFGEEKETPKATPTKFDTTESHAGLVYSCEANYNFSEKMLLGFGIKRMTMSDFKMTMDASSPTVASIKDFESTEFALRFNILF